jgi:uncharacterized protein
MTATEPQRTRMEPPVTEAAAQFWEATRCKELQIPWCNACGKAFWYPRELCPNCLSDDIEWRPASGAGTVYSCSTMAKPANPLMADRVPYVVALVELQEGPRLMTNIVGCDPADVRIGLPVQVTWEELSDGRNLALFEPA